MYHANVNVNVTIEIVIQFISEITKIVAVIVKNIYMKKIIPGILLYVIVKIVNI